MVTHDNITRMSTAQDLASMGATLNSTKVIPLSAAHDIASGRPAYCHVYLDTAIVADGDITVDVVAVTDTSHSSPVSLGKRTLPNASSIAGANFYIALSPLYGLSLGAAYIGVIYSREAAATVTSGSITTDITLDSGTEQPIYATGTTIDVS